MKPYIEQLQGQLGVALSETTVISNKIKQYDTATDVVRAFAKQLRLHVLAQKKPFPSRKAEMDYFRHMAPSFYSQLYYYKLLYNLEVYR